MTWKPESHLRKCPFLHHAHQRRRYRPHGSLRPASCPKERHPAPAEKAPLFFPSKAERRKTMFIRRYTARPGKTGEKVTKLNPLRAARPHPAPWCSTPEASAPPEDGSRVPKRAPCRPGKMRRSVKDAYPAHALAAPTVKHFHALGVPAFQNHGILQTIRELAIMPHQLILQPRFIAGRKSAINPEIHQPV